jgi:peroxiredoxin
MSTEFDNSANTIDTKIGLLAPNFKLKASNDREIALSSFRGTNNVVLFFIREFN